MKRVDINLPTFGFVVASRAALGVGIGLLLAGRMSESRRRTAGLALVACGAATTIPAAIAVFRSVTTEAQRASRHRAPRQTEETMQRSVDSSNADVNRPRMRIDLRADARRH